MDADPADRAAILDEACADDDDLRREVEDLLAADTDGGGLHAVVEDAVRAVATADEGEATAPQDMDGIGVAMGELVDGRYEVARVLGSGGMGVVVEAEHVSLRERVAIKLLKPHALTTKRARKRFIAEARAAARMRSEHIVKIRDVGELPSGAPFMVMDMLVGADLAAVMRQRSPLPQAEAVSIALQACAALATAHAAGIVHRDIKPGNLFLEQASHGEVVVKLLDFGISKLLDGADGGEGVLTRSSDLVGSPAYMSPEQLRSSKDVDARADIWSLGVVLYEMLAGERPIVAPSLAELCAAILSDDIPDLEPQYLGR